VIEAGRVGRPHGLDGSFHVTRPIPDLLAAASTLTLSDREAAIERRAGTPERPIMRVAGVDSREAAEALRGTPVLVDIVE